MAHQDILSSKQQEELMKKFQEDTDKLSKAHDTQKQQQLLHLRDKMAERRHKKLSKLQAQQEAEMSEV